MGDLQNDFPSWGETGALPSSGFFYEGGDQVNEKHLDALWYNVKTHFDMVISGMQDRVTDIEGDVILDGGLVASKGSNTREVDVSASSAGAYVDGQKTGSTSSTTLTLSSNGGSSTRTDSIWVDTNGSVGATEGTTSVGDGRMKIAEVDVATDDTISTIRNYGRDRARSFAAENPDSGQVPGGFLPGDIWYDHSADKLKSRINGAWHPLLPADGSQPIVGDLDFNGNSISSVDNINGGGANTISSLTTNGNSWRFYDNTNNQVVARFDEGGFVKFPNGNVSFGSDIHTTGGTTIWDSSNGYVPSSSVQDAWVDESGDSMSGTLDVPRIDVNGTVGSASTDGSQGIGAPTVYTNMVEAPTEKGDSSTYIELGSGGSHSSVGADEIGLILNGEVRAKSHNNGDFSIEGTFSENASL